MSCFSSVLQIRINWSVLSSVLLQLSWRRHLCRWVRSWPGGLRRPARTVLSAEGSGTCCGGSAAAVAWPREPPKDRLLTPPGLTFPCWGTRAAGSNPSLGCSWAGPVLLRCLRSRGWCCWEGGKAGIAVTPGGGWGLWTGSEFGNELLSDLKSVCYYNWTKSPFNVAWIC